MASTTILSDNGVSSGSAGIKTTGGNDGVLALQTTTAGGTATTAVTIDTSQKVGIGTSSPSVNLDVTGGSAPNIKVSSTSNVYTYLTMNAWALDRAQLRAEATNPGAGSGTGSGILSFWTAGNPTMTERMRIDASGNLLVGATSQISLDKVGITFNGSTHNGLVLKTTYATLGSSYALFYNSAGGLAGQISQSGTTAVTYATTSDYRLKENVQPMTGALAKVAALKPVNYTWKVDGSDGQGFIAHELQAVVPECVIGEKDAVDGNGNPKYQGIDTSFLVATLTAAIQEQQALITTLTERITALEAK